MGPDLGRWPTARGIQPPAPDGHRRHGGVTAGEAAAPGPVAGRGPTGDDGAPSEEQVDALGLAGRVPDEHFLVLAELRVNELIQRDGPVYQVGL